MKTELRARYPLAMGESASLLVKDSSAEKRGGEEGAGHVRIPVYGGKWRSGGGGGGGAL